MLAKMVRVQWFWSKLLFCASISASANRDDGEMQEAGEQVSAFKNYNMFSC